MDSDFTKYHQDMALTLKITFNAENPVLISFPIWGHDTPVSSHKTEENEVKLFCYSQLYYAIVLFLLKLSFFFIKIPFYSSST